MDTPQDYDPTLFHQTQNTLYANHFKFEIERLPDLSFFVQSASIPSVTVTRLDQSSPFVEIPHPGSKLVYSTFNVTYLIDAKFKNYFSLYYWLKGVGFPHDYDEVVRFRATQSKLTARPGVLKAIELEKTRATMMVLLPDTGTLVAEILYEDVFPIDMNTVEFSTTSADAPVLTASCTFACSTFEIKTYL